MSEQTTSERLIDGLTRWLTEHRGASVRVENLVQVSAGARRINALFDAISVDATIERLAVTALPTLDIQILPMTVEAAVRQLAHDAGVPTPRILGATNDASYVGGPFFVSERIDGETIPRRVLRLVEQHGIGELVGCPTRSSARPAALDRSCARSTGPAPAYPGTDRSCARRRGPGHGHAAAPEPGHGVRNAVARNPPTRRTGSARRSCTAIPATET